MRPRRLVSLRALLLSTVIACLLLPAPPAAHADTVSDLKAAQDKQAQFDTIRHQLGDNIASALQAQDQLKQALEDNRKQRTVLAGDIGAANARLAEIGAELTRLDADILATQHRLAIEEAQLRAVARAAYVQPASVLVGLAESTTLADFMTRLSDLNVAGQRAREIKSQIATEQAHLVAACRAAETARDEQWKVRDALAAKLAKLTGLQADQEKAKAALGAKIEQTKGELTRVNKQSTEQAQAVTELLQRQQDEIIAGGMQSVWDAVQSGAAPGTFTATAGHSKKYRFIWPLPLSQISQKFGPTDLGFEPSYQGYPHFHTGLDMAAPQGTPVLAPDDGVVVLVGSGSTGYGNFVVIAHTGGIDTLYGHLQLAVVKTGDAVQQGQPIGLEGSTGNSTGPHLHLEVRTAGKMVDPALYLPSGQPSPLRD